MSNVYAAQQRAIEPPSYFLRLPGASFPPAAATGDGRIDAYLYQLDNLLAGSATVRQQTLGEIANHMLEHKAALRDAGSEQSTASERAVAAMGPAAELAGAQRRSLRAQFIRLAVSAGVMGCLFGMIVFPEVTKSIDGSGKYVSSLGYPAALAWGAMFGPFLAWFSVYVMSLNSKPPAVRAAGCRSVLPGHDGDVFYVAWSLWLRLISLIQAVLVWYALLMYIIDCRDRLAWNFSSYGEQPGLYDWFAMTFVVAIYVVSGLVLLSLTYSCCVSERGVRYWSWFIPRRFTWSDVRRTGLLSDLYPWAPIGWRKTRYVEYSVNGKRRRMLIYPQMENADRLFARCSEAAAQAGDAPAS